ncbi:MAG: hypothetical protein LBT59_04595 [Clostridiales bacterium]|nr:hypothetical protein [Clostridiales bacterium]
MKDLQGAHMSANKGLAIFYFCFYFCFYCPVKWNALAIDRLENNLPGNMGGLGLRAKCKKQKLLSRARGRSSARINRHNPLRLPGKK